MAKDMAAAAEISSATPDVHILNRNDVTDDQLNFVSNLDELDAALEAHNIIVQFKNPDPEGDPIAFELAPMTPGQFAIYYNTLLGHTYMETARAGTSLEAGQAEQAEPSSVLDADAEEKLQDELAVKKYDTKLLNILESCIKRPVGITADRLRRWDAFYIVRMHNALMEGSRPSKSVAQFPTVDKRSGE